MDVDDQDDYGRDDYDQDDSNHWDEDEEWYKDENDEYQDDEWPDTRRDRRSVFPLNAQTLAAFPAIPNTLSRSNSRYQNITSNTQTQRLRHAQTSSGPSITHLRNDRRPPYPPPRRTPQTFTCPSSDFDQSGSTTASIERGLSIIHPLSFHEYFNLPLGHLPPEAVCVRAQKNHLAQIPLRNVIRCNDITLIHRHFFSKATQEELEENQEAAQFIFCRAVANGFECKYFLKKNDSTVRRLKHIRDSHMWMMDELIEFRLSQGESPLATSRLFRAKPNSQAAASGSQAAASSSHVAESSSQSAESTKNLRPFSNHEMQALARILASSIAIDEFPFSVIESGLLTNVLRFLRPNCQLPSRATIENAMLKEYCELLSKTKKVFAKEVVLGSLTADTWTSKRGDCNILSLTFHYIQPDFTPCSVAIGFTPMQTEYTGEALKNAIEMTLDELGLLKRVACCTAGDGTDIKPAMSRLANDHGFEWVACSAHAMQLCVKSAIANTPGVKDLLEKCWDLSPMFRYIGLKDLLYSAQKSLQPSVTPLKPVDYCPTGRSSTYLMAERIVQLLPAINHIVDKLRSPTASKAEKRDLMKLELSLIEQDEEPILESVLELLKPTHVFADDTYGDRLPHITDVYSRIHEMISEMSKITTTNPIIKDFRDNLVREIEIRWDVEAIPDMILISAFLNPSSVASKFFAHTIQTDDQRITIRHRARGCVLKSLLAMKKTENSRVLRRAGFNNQRWTDEFERELGLYVDMAQHDRPNTCQTPHEWWQSRAHHFPHLSGLARAYLSIQASSDPSKRLSSRTGNMLVKKETDFSEFIFAKCQTIRQLTWFHSQIDAKETQDQPNGRISPVAIQWADPAWKDDS